MWLGIDLGTSGVKVVLVDDDGLVAAEATHALSIARPHDGWSEQDPEHWWAATEQAVQALPAKLRRSVRGVGLAGQMHGATLLDGSGRALRPAMLWNDGRATRECAEIDADGVSRMITGNAAMPGLTRPKVDWVRRHEPDVFTRVRKVLLPKDYLRLRMTGDAATDMSDASGTLWLDVAKRDWSDPLLDASGLDRRHMPSLHEGSAATGCLRAEIAAHWGMARVPVAAGGGDNAAAAIGCGLTRPGQALLSLGTSGVLFVVTDRPRPAPQLGTHSFCHAVPACWHQMAVTLSAASALDWVARLCRFESVETALLAPQTVEPFTTPVVFLPYLAGERTPHNDAAVRGCFAGLGHATDAGHLVAAVLEGVAFALADGQDAVQAAGASIDTIFVVGGGARSKRWCQVLATALGRPLERREEAHLGPASGAARLARLAVSGEPIEDVVTAPRIVDTIEPDAALAQASHDQRRRYRALYPAIRESIS